MTQTCVFLNLESTAVSLKSHVKTLVQGNKRTTFVTEKNPKKAHINSIFQSIAIFAVLHFLMLRNSFPSAHLSANIHFGYSQPH